MKSIEFIVETHGGVWRLIRSMVPQHWPDYVVKDWFYSRLTDPNHPVDKRNWIEWTLKEWPVRQWKLETLELGFHSFDSRTQGNILKRISEVNGLASDFIPRDAERHQAQKQLIQKTGQANQEPIIVIYHKDGYELLEGWHRTIQNIQAFPNGYKAKAWVGYL